MADQITPLDRLWRQIQQLIRGEIRSLVGWPGVYEYTIVTVNGTGSSATLDAIPVDSSIGLPSLHNATISASPIGSYTPVSGKLCHVLFADTRRTKPRVVWCEPNDGSPVGRQGDPVSVTIPIGTVVIAATGATLNPAPITLNGTIQAGSSQVSSE